MHVIVTSYVCLVRAAITPAASHRVHFDAMKVCVCSEIPDLSIYICVYT